MVEKCNMLQWEMCLELSKVQLCQAVSWCVYFSFFSSIRPISRGPQINYREEEKKILDSILGRDVYDNRIRPSGRNGTGQYYFINEHR